MINKISDLRLAIIGLGYVGLPLALEFSKKKPVIGFDNDKKRISELNSGIDKNFEFDKNSLKKSVQLWSRKKLDKLNWFKRNYLGLIFRGDFAL